MNDRDSFGTAFTFVRALRLPQPDGQLLECFLLNSIDRARAANYLLQRCGPDSGDAGAVVTFLIDWKRLIACCEPPTGP